jgi:Crinkler effector protein N-terminal domain
MPYTLLCILIGGTTPFPVTINETQSVGELKAIKKKKEPELDAFAADALTLYKVDIDGSDNEKCIKEVQDIPQELGHLTKAEKLHPPRMLSKYSWELNPTKDREGDSQGCWNLLLRVVRANRMNVFVFGLAVAREGTCRLAMSYIFSTICLLILPYYSRLFRHLCKLTKIFIPGKGNPCL